jgi:hypothetical protein
MFRDWKKRRDLQKKIAALKEEKEQQARAHAQATDRNDPALALAAPSSSSGSRMRLGINTSGSDYRSYMVKIPSATSIANCCRGRHNNGMHPTRISVDVIRKVGCLSHFVRAGDAGR